MNPLLFSPEQHAQAFALLADFSARYLGGVATRPVFPGIDRSSLAVLQHQTLPREGQSLNPYSRSLKT